MCSGGAPSATVCNISNYCICLHHNYIFWLCFFVLPMASGAVGVQDGGKFAPGNALGRPPTGEHHPLESFVVVGGAVAIPGGDTARQDALNCASVKVGGC